MYIPSPLIYSNYQQMAGVSVTNLSINSCHHKDTYVVAEEVFRLLGEIILSPDHLDV